MARAFRPPNVRAAVAAAELGDNGLAADLIRHQARIGGASDHERLLHLAARLNLTATQMWLAHNGPRGQRTTPMIAIPRPVAAAAVLAGRSRSGLRHALQESISAPTRSAPPARAA